nr:MAG TPA: hypothetical protein [Caudoviricetes sp.]
MFTKKCSNIRLFCLNKYLIDFTKYKKSASAENTLSQTTFF